MKAIMGCAVLLLAFAIPTHATGAATHTNRTDGWSVVAPAEVGINAPRLSLARDYAMAPDQNTQGVVIVRSGHIAAEWYAPGKQANSWAASWSMAKSVTSLLIGIAIDKGLIASVDEPMSTWIPSWKDTPKQSITLRDVLEMSSGLANDESLDVAQSAKSSVIQMALHQDQLVYSQQRPQAAAPGTKFSYSSPDAMLLSTVLRRATSMPVTTFANRYLFGPLGIRQFEWWSDAQGNTLTYCCLDSTTRNFARIGLLVMDHGLWHGKRIVSESWLKESMTPSTISGGGYGYQWWILHLDGVPGTVYEMNGHDGQLVYLIPALDLVVARNGTYAKSGCPAVATPNLFSRYSPSGLVPGSGTEPPKDWDDGRFLRLIVASVKDRSAPRVTPKPESRPSSRTPDGAALRPCPDPQAVNAPLARAPVASPQSLLPTYTG